MSEQIKFSKWWRSRLFSFCETDKPNSYYGFTGIILPVTKFATGIAVFRTRDDGWIVNGKLRKIGFNSSELFWSLVLGKLIFKLYKRKL